LFHHGTLLGLTDRQLLDRFLSHGDQAAFRGLFERHAPAVLSVCRRILRDPHDADDAFQATFLILARRGSSVTGCADLSPWLYRVALRVAQRLSRNSARRRAREQAIERSDPPDHPKEPARGTDELLDHLLGEVDRLPDRYRSPIVLCYLRGYTHEEASRALSWPLASLLAQSARAQKLEPVTSTLQETSLRTVQGALGFPGAAAASPVITQLAEGVLTSMFLCKLRWAATAIAALAMGMTGLGIVATQQGAGENSAKAAEDTSTSPHPPAPDNRAVEASIKAREALQGVWYRTSSRAAGKEWLAKLADAKNPSVPAPDSSAMRLTISGNEFRFGDEGGEVDRVVLDPTREPAEIDLVQVRGPVNVGSLIKGIYKQENDRLTLCLAIGSTRRPTAFSAENIEAHVLDVYERAGPLPVPTEPASAPPATDDPPDSNRKPSGIEGFYSMPRLIDKSGIHEPQDAFIQVKIERTAIHFDGPESAPWPGKIKVAYEIHALTDPKQIDLYYTMAPHTRPLVWKGLYRRNRHLLELIFDPTEKTRPDSFEIKHGDPHRLWILAPQQVSSPLVNAAGAEGPVSALNATPADAANPATATTTAPGAVAKRVDPTSIEQGRLSLARSEAELDADTVSLEATKNALRKQIEFVNTLSTSLKRQSAPKTNEENERIRAEKDEESEYRAQLREQIKELRDGIAFRSVELEERRLNLARERAKLNEQARLVSIGQPRRAKPGDLLMIEVLQALPGRPISGERRVHQDGKLSLGFYGEIPVAGLTRHEIKVQVIHQLRKYLSDESLGLVAEGANGNRVPVKPEDSDRVFVEDELERESSGDGGSFNERLDRIERAIHALENRGKP
jgi:RNA polymerase sigma factor (sigma-70 family)